MVYTESFRVAFLEPDIRVLDVPSGKDRVLTDKGADKADTTPGSKGNIDIAPAGRRLVIAAPFTDLVGSGLQWVTADTLTVTTNLRRVTRYRFGPV